MNKDITSIKKNTINIKTTENKRKSLYIPFDFYGQGLKFGLLSGISMALFLFALTFLGFEDSIGLKFFKYLILAAALGYALKGQKDFLAEHYQFKKGILFGLFLTVVSAITLAAMNMLAFTFTETLAFAKFSVPGDSTGNFIVITGIIFFETLVYGMVITFIFLQYLKTRKQAK